MIKLIGNKNCSRCSIIKAILNKKNIDYEYLDESVAKKYVDMAIEKGIREFPLIIIDENFVDWNTLKENI